MSPRKMIAAGIAGAALAVSLTGCGGSSTVGPGEVVDAYDAAVGGNAVRLVVPTGQVAVTFGHRTDTAPGGRHAADGTELLPIMVAFDPTQPSTLLDLVAATGGTPQPTALSLAYGDSTVDLPAPYDVEGDATTPEDHTVYVAVPHGTSARLAVTYDGLTQSVAEDGTTTVPAQAQALARTVGGTARRPCPRATWRPALQLASCTLDVAIVTPYAGATGWAPAGHSWVVTGVQLRAAGPAASGLSLALSGAGPVRTLTSSHGPDGVVLRGVFSVTRFAGSIDVTVRRAGAAAARATLPLPAAARVRIG